MTEFKFSLHEIRAEHNVTAEAAWLPVTSEILHDAPALQEHLNRGIWQTMDRMLRPWAYPDRAPSWKFEPFPRIEAVRRAWRHRAARMRSRTARRLDRLADAVRGSERSNGYDDW